jgi:hypothetical protein
MLLSCNGGVGGWGSGCGKVNYRTIPTSPRPSGVEGAESEGRMKGGGVRGGKSVWAESER